MLVPPGSFPGQPEQNPMEHINVVVTRSGKQSKSSERGGVHVEVSKNSI